LCITYVPGGKPCRCFAYPFTRRVVGIADGACGFINAFYLTVNTPGNTVYPVIASNARLGVINKVAYGIIAVIGGTGLVPQVKVVPATANSIIDGIVGIIA
jgi:hypothetical protein